MGSGSFQVLDPRVGMSHAPAHSATVPASVFKLTHAMGSGNCGGVPEMELLKIDSGNGNSSRIVVLGD